MTLDSFCKMWRDSRKSVPLTIGLPRLATGNRSGHSITWARTIGPNGTRDRMIAFRGRHLVTDYPDKPPNARTSVPSVRRFCVYSAKAPGTTSGCQFNSASW